jgi:hypothetical protein
VILAVAGVIWWHAQAAPNVGVATVTRLDAAPASPSGAPTPTPGAMPSIPVHVGTLPTAAPTTVVPVQVRIGRLGVSATVIPTGLDSSGNVVIPSNVKTVGWYEYGPGLDATAGSMVIAGHVDNVAQGDGAFFHLRELNPGDTFTVSGAGGVTRTFRVVAREEYPKATIQLDRYFATTGSFRVTLMTCGGSFDAATGHYRDNVAVTAVPAG